jgi:hypothetical protein
MFPAFHSGPDGDQLAGGARRPEVSSLVLKADRCGGAGQAVVAAEIGRGGAAQLKAMLTEAVNVRRRWTMSGRDGDAVLSGARPR